MADRSSVRFVKSPVALRRPSTHSPKCKCTLCAPRLDFDGRRAEEKTEIERLREENARLKAENHELKVNRRAERRAEREEAARVVAEMARATEKKLAEKREKKLRVSTDPRLKRLAALRAKGIGLAAAFNQIDREDETP